MQTLKSIYWTTYRKVKATHLYWYHVKNFRNGSFLGIRKPLVLSPYQKKAIRALKQTGIFVMHIDELPGAEAPRRMEDLEAAVRGKRSEEIETNADKPYLIQIMQHQYTDRDNVFARFALQKTLTDIAKGYFGMSVKLCYYDAWVNLPRKDPSTHSQLWHRDPEDLKTLKVFLYLVDVDERNGAFSYVPQTHKVGRLSKAQPDILDYSGGNQRSSDEQMVKSVPREAWMTCTGKKGTLILADTSGFHKGGHCTDRERVLFTCTYTSLASKSKNCMANIVLPR